MSEAQVDEAQAVRRGLEEATRRGASRYRARSKYQRQLPARNLAILKDRLFQCRTYRELADDHGITAATVRHILDRSVRLAAHSEQTITDLMNRIEDLRY